MAPPFYDTIIRVEKEGALTTVPPLRKSIMRAQQLRTQLSPVEKSICSAALCLYGVVLRRSHLFVSVPSPLFLTNAAELIMNTGHIVKFFPASAAWSVCVPACLHEPRGYLPVV